MRLLTNLFVALTILLGLAKPTPIPTPTPILDLPLPTITKTPPSSIPTLKPISKPSTKPTTKLSPTPKKASDATIVSGDTCGGYNFSAPSSSIKVTLNFTTGSKNTLKIVELRSPGCAAINSKSTDKTTKALIGEAVETSFGNLYPGDYKIRVQYGTNLTWSSEYSTNTSPGQTSTVTVNIP